MDPQTRIDNALKVATRFGGIDEDHHKAWVIDQMVRALTGCSTPRGRGVADDVFGGFEESEEYREFVRKTREGEGGPETYDWKTGITP